MEIPIPEVQDSIMWSKLSTGAWVNLNNDTANGRNYGKLYNGYAVVIVEDYVLGVGTYHPMPNGQY